MMGPRAGARHWGLAAAAGLVLIAATACAAGHGRPAAARLTDANPAAGTYVALGDSYTSAPLTLNELGGNPYFYDPAFVPLACAGCQDAAHMLNTGVGTTTLSTRTVYIAKEIGRASCRERVCMLV